CQGVSSRLRSSMRSNASGSLPSLPSSSRACSTCSAVTSPCLIAIWAIWVASRVAMSLVLIRTAPQARPRHALLSLHFTRSRSPAKKKTCVFLPREGHWGREGRPESRVGCRRSGLPPEFLDHEDDQHHLGGDDQPENDAELSLD